jgi:hypothetical protein
VAAVSSYVVAIQLWQTGERLLAAAEPVKRIAMDRVRDELVAELRRRLGGTFTVEELVELYDRGTSWCMEVAVNVAPNAPWAWDERIVADAAFAAYVRGAADFAGGSRILAEDV